MKELKLTILLALLLPVCAASAPQAQSIPSGYTKPTTIELVARGPDGAPVPLATANIYLDIWGSGQLVTLPVIRNSVSISLDHDSLCKAWSELCRNRLYDPARLILKADGFAPITAQVYWPQQDLAGIQTTTAGILLSESRNIRLPEGSTQRIDVAFRRPVRQTLRIVDESGKPAAGIEVETSIYYAASNHMGIVEGESLPTRKTDADGRMSIPDVSGELALELRRGPYVLLNPDRVSRWRKIVIPEGSPGGHVLTLTIHRFQRQAIQWTVINRSGSTDGLVLSSCLKFCSGACCGWLARVDARGQVRVENFYPEETESLSIVDEGTTLWKATAEEIQNPSSIRTITIPAPAPR